MAWPNAQIFLKGQHNSLSQSLLHIYLCRLQGNNGAVALIKERKTLTTYNSILHYCVIKNMVVFVSGSWSEPLNPWNVPSDRNACGIHGGA